MALYDQTILGVLELDEGLSPDSPCLAPREGSLLNPATFGVQIITEMVEGALPDVVIRGESSLQEACVLAAKRLVERGADVISADCGFLIRHQAAISAAVDKPVVTSSLLLLPALLRQLDPGKKLAVITADSRHCTEDLLGVENEQDRMRVVIGGIEGGEYIRNALARPYVRTELEQIEHEVGACIARLRSNHPEIAIILFECTGFACVASALRKKTNLPIYDISAVCRLTLASIDAPLSI
ncbi:Asp/Glu/hydantoin racemase [Rhizobium etli]|uniref:Asp/Glu/hydantoin racemase n=1 Tax=Rhizobium etli TaxID=29449 RepID=UPI00038398AB|nr:Asp/Glu/hydantoin racemase [Rhizobium etli]AGS24472.1 Asp/Glu/hydantoin racemase protein [Rhizobium etli bv. mimosae str. Mim1]